MPRTTLRIHGDNIVECERTLNIIKTALGGLVRQVSRPFGSAACPSLLLELNAPPHEIEVTFFPGFGRWDHDILSFVRASGGKLREAADAILTRVDNNLERPLLAIEYCGALPAGNQAWQRNGRAYSFGLAHIPYLYVAELGGYELAPDRSRKAARMPNPAVPFSYLSHSLEQRTPVLPIMTTSPGADAASRLTYGSAFSDDQFALLMRSLILNQDPTPAFTSILERVLQFIAIRAAAMRTRETLSPDQWRAAYAALQSGSRLTDFLLANAAMNWSKTAYIADLTPTARQLMDFTANHARGLTSSKLPMCIIPAQNRPTFAEMVSRLYPTISPAFLTWLRRNSHLTICWVMGFKPRGDDARPDRGLPPLTRMMIGPTADLLCVVYGPAPSDTWPLLNQDPATLVLQNGLWEAILETSDALLVDSATDTITTHGFLKSHWQQLLTPLPTTPILVTPSPIRVGEQDVDTVIHTLLYHFTGNDVFEGMCNPPGGDWSGISLLTADRTTELRWLSLPRVSASQAKRPDHVFQFFGLSPRPLVLAIESKETAAAVETDIGPRLTRYVAELTSSAASIHRPDNITQWNHSVHRIPPGTFDLASAVAFIPTTSTDMTTVAAKAACDLILGCTFEPAGAICHLELMSATPLGILLARYIQQHASPTISVVLARAQ